MNKDFQNCSAAEKYTYTLKVSNAFRGAVGMLHFGVALWVGQKPVVRTLTLRSTPCKDVCNNYNDNQITFFKPFIYP